MNVNGTKIRELRKAAGLSQKEVAGPVGVSQAMVSQIESGRRTCSRDTADAIAKALGCSPKEITGSPHSRWRGHAIVCRDDKWFYKDTGQHVTENPDRPCGHCGKKNRGDGHDPCLGELPGVKSACCGHGVREDSFVIFTNGVILRGFERTER